MSGWPLAARVVEVIADLGKAAHPRYRYGSGCVVAGRTVLTAAHVVQDAVSVKVRDSDKVLHEAALDPGFIGDIDGPGPDLALVEISGSGIDVPGMGLAAVDRDSSSADPVEGCHAIGYPSFMQREAPGGGRFRETADAIGQIPVLSGLVGGLLSVQVSSAPRPLPPGRTALGESQWSGMSGGPVIAGGLLLGVVSEHAPRQGDSAIMAVPLTALEADPAHPGHGEGVADPGAWWARLGVAGVQALQRVPAPRHRTEPDYWATVRAIRQRTAMLVGRQGELAEIRAFATGAEGYRWLTGGAWAGKTSLLAEAVAALQGECDVVSYFLSRREADADSSHFLAIVVPQLGYLLEEHPQVAELHQFRALWQRAAERAEAEDRPLLLVVDGLDEDLRPPGLPSVAALLPPVAGGSAHVLVSSRPLTELPVDLPPGHPLAHTQPLPVAPFEGGQELAQLAREEIAGLVRDSGRLAIHLLGLLTAATGPLAVGDLIRLSRSLDASSADESAQPLAELSLDEVIDADRFLTENAARSLQQVGTSNDLEWQRYQYAHASLLEYAQTDRYLGDRRFRDAIHRWARSWSALGWPVIANDPAASVPRYLLANYASTLAPDPQRLAALVSDVGWTEAAIRSVGVDHVLADLRRAVAANPASTAVAAMLAVISGQAHSLRHPQPVDQPGYVLRQLCLQAAELSEDDLAGDLRRRLQSTPGPGLALVWTTRWASRALSVELGHTDAGVSAVAALPDGRAVTVDGDGRVLVWDPAAPGTDPAEIGCHNSLVYSLAVLPDGQVVTGGNDQRVLIWDPAAPGSRPAKLGTHNIRVEAVAALPDGRIITGEYDGRVLVWDPAAPGTDPAEIGRHNQWVRTVAVLPDARVVTGADDWRVLIWDPAAPGASPVEIGDYHGRVYSLAALPDGRIITGEYDRRVLIWDPAAPGADPVELGRHDDSPVQDLAALPDGRVVTGEYDGRVLVWDPATPSADPAVLGRHDSSSPNVAVLPSGQVITGGGDRRVLVWDPAAPAMGSLRQDRHRGQVRALAMLPGGQVITGRSDGRLQVWDLAAPSPDPIEVGRHDGGVTAMAVLPGGQMMVSGGYTSQVLVWDLAVPGTALAELELPLSGVRAVAMLPSGQVIIGGGGAGRVWLWDPAAPAADPAELGVQGSPVEAVAALPDGQVVTGGFDGRVLLWDPAAPAAGPAEVGHHGRWVRAVAVLPGGQVVTGADDGRVLLWDPAAPAAGPAELGRHDGPVQAMAVLPGGQVVSGGGDGRVLVWDGAAAEPGILQLSCTVTALAATPLDTATSCLAIAHQGTGFSTWSVRI